MNVEAFVTARRADWEELSALAKRAKGKPERLGTEGLHRLGTLYRAAAADLALARRRYPHDNVVPFLDEIVGRARHVVYDRTRRGESFLQFVTTTYWQRIAARPVLLLLALFFLAAPAGLGARWAVDDPGGAAGFAPAQYRSVTEPRRSTDLELGAGESAAFSSAIFTNNIRVTFMAFAGGALLGLGTIASLAYNGALLGVIGGLAAGSGNGSTFAELVVPHGVLELSCIVVAGAAGLRLGAAVIAPGRRRRGEAVVSEARAAVLIILGTAPWLVLAGLVEGFITPEGIGLGPAITVGVLFGGAYWALLLWRGFMTRSPLTIAPAP